MRRQRPNGSLAQLGEHLPYKQRVTGSSPVTSTTKTTHESEWFFFLSLETTGVPGYTRRAALHPVWAAAFFQHRLSGGANCASMFAPNGREVFSLRFSEEMRRLRTAGTCRAPRRGKRVDTKISTLLTPTFFWESTAKFAELRLAKERQSGYHSVDFIKYSQFTDSVLLHIRSTLRRARHNSAAQFFCML